MFSKTYYSAQMMDCLLAEMKAAQKTTDEMKAARLVAQSAEMMVRMMDCLSAEMKDGQKVPPTAEMMASSLAETMAETMARMMEN
jgi:hypothetical protein